MPAGIEILNAIGTVVLDQNLANPVVRASGNITTVANSITSQPGLSQFTVTYSGFSGSIPLCAIQPTTYSAMLISAKNTSGNTWEFTYLGDFPVAASVAWWVFDKPPSTSLSFGLEVFDQTGALSFAMHNKPLRVAGVVPAGFTAESGRVYAVIIAKFAIKQYWQMGGFDYSYNYDLGYYTKIGEGEVIRFHPSYPNGYSVGLIQHSYDPYFHPYADPIDEFDSTPNNFLIVDVTHF